MKKCDNCEKEFLVLNVFTQQNSIKYLCTDCSNDVNIEHGIGTIISIENNDEAKTQGLNRR